MAFGLYQRALVLRTDQHGRITIKADENGHHKAYVERTATPTQP